MSQLKAEASSWIASLPASLEKMASLSSSERPSRRLTPSSLHASASSDPLPSSSPRAEARPTAISAPAEAFASPRTSMTSSTMAPTLPQSASASPSPPADPASRDASLASGRMSSSSPGWLPEPRYSAFKLTDSSNISLACLAASGVDSSARVAATFLRAQVLSGIGLDPSLLLCSFLSAENLFLFRSREASLSTLASTSPRAPAAPPPKILASCENSRAPSSASRLSTVFRTSLAADLRKVDAASSPSAERKRHRNTGKKASLLNLSALPSRVRSSLESRESIASRDSGRNAGLVLELESSRSAQDPSLSSRSAKSASVGSSRRGEAPASSAGAPRITSNTLAAWTSSRAAVAKGDGPPSSDSAAAAAAAATSPEVPSPASSIATRRAKSSRVSPSIPAYS
mmetsp:Transcript_8857/g.31928  ORF Transcript_8857/g.31928 Transcript_8857/m.31928 type:complete len:402 (+) Transcript_8857:157-1362(+)